MKLPTFEECAAIDPEDQTDLQRFIRTYGLPSASYMLEAHRDFHAQLVAVLNEVRHPGQEEWTI